MVQAGSYMLFTPEFLETERRARGEHAFKRAYFGVPGAGWVRLKTRGGPPPAAAAKFGWGAFVKG